MPVKSPVDKLLFKRELGGIHSTPFVRSFSTNSVIATKYELRNTIEEHHGCVNTISWNKSGSLLVSGSDDKRLCIYDHNRGGKLVHAIKTGHSANIFSAKFLPYNDDHIICCAGDSTIRAFKNFKMTNLFECHSNRAKKLSTISQNPFVFYSASEDSTIRRFDLREHHQCSRTGSGCNNTIYILTSPEVEIRGEAIEAFSIAVDPFNPHYIIAGGSDPYMRLFDTRAEGNNDPVKTFCPAHLTGRATDLQFIGHITGVAYSWNGRHALATRSGNAVEMYDVHASAAEVVNESVLKFTGHCNIRTVKEVNFIGTRSEFVASGSDDGNIFLWDADPNEAVEDPGRTQDADVEDDVYTHGKLLNILSGDRSVVNCCAGHPYDPLFASSGIENDVKIWMPSGKQTRLFHNAERIMDTNNQRHASNSNRAHMLPSSMLQALLRAMEGPAPGRNVNIGVDEDVDEDDDDEGDVDSDQEENADDVDDYDEEPRRGRRARAIQCAQQ